MTKKNKFEKGNSSLSNKKLKKVTSKRNSWKHQMYELEIAIAKESSNKKRDELIKLHNGYTFCKPRAPVWQNCVGNRLSPVVLSDDEQLRHQNESW